MTTHYETKAADHLHMFLPEHATVDAILGLAYEQRTANLVALMHLDNVATETLTIASAQILERLNLSHHEANK